METPPIQSRRLRDYTSTLFEVFIVAFTIIPFLVLAYFYQSLPTQVPLFLNLSGEVETWAEKNIVSVFWVPLLALITQVALLIVKYGTVQSNQSHLSTRRSRINFFVSASVCGIGCAGRWRLR